MQPDQVQPYDVWNFTLPNTSGSTTIGGVAYDPSTGRVYVSVERRQRSDHAPPCR